MNTILLQEEYIKHICTYLCEFNKQVNILTSQEVGSIVLQDITYIFAHKKKYQN